MSAAGFFIALPDWNTLPDSAVLAIHQKLRAALREPDLIEHRDILAAYERGMRDGLVLTNIRTRSGRVTLAFEQVATPINPVSPLSRLLKRS